MKHYKKSGLILIIMLMTMMLLSFVNKSENIQPAKPFDSFPMKIGDWQGFSGKFEERIYDVLGVDDSVLATYTSETKGSVHLYVGFYQSQKEGDLIHSPKNCLPGSGWKITDTSIEILEVPTQKAPDENPSGEKVSADNLPDRKINDKEKNHKKYAQKINVIRLRLEKGSQKQVVLYWFQSRGRIISSEYMQKIWLVIDSITKNRTDGSFVRLISPVMDNEEKTLERMKGFAAELFPYLIEYLPS